MRMSKMSLFEDQTNDSAQDPITAIYTAIRDNAVITGKRTFLWAELTTLLGRSHTVSFPYHHLSQCQRPSYKLIHMFFRAKKSLFYE